MDDFSHSTLYEAKNEWAARLLNILTPLIIDGYKSILEEAIKICKENGEFDKYLMTFQNFISRVPKWNTTIIEMEKKRICEKSGCSYLEDLVVCTHIIQLKILTAMRVGQKQKKIDINIPNLNDFIHKIYINVARKIYKNVYLFEMNIQPLQIQKNNRELEIIVQECILNTIRESIPVESILKAYMDETTEEEVIEEIKEQLITEKNQIQPNNNLSQSLDMNNVNGIESVKETNNLVLNKSKENDYNGGSNRNNIVSPSITFKDVNDNYQSSNIYNEFNNNSRTDDYESDEDIIKISDERFDMSNLDVHNLDEPDISIMPELLDDIEILE